MEIRKSFSTCFNVLLVTYLLNAQVVRADKNATDVDFDAEEAENDEKISASLKIERNHFRNKTDKQNQPIKIEPETHEPNHEVLPIIRHIPIQKFANESQENVTQEFLLQFGSEAFNEEGDDEISEDLPEAQELRYLKPSSRRRISYRPTAVRPSLNRRNVLPDPPQSAALRPPRRPAEYKITPPTEKDCTFFTKTVCLQASDYPHEAIMRSIRSNKEMVSALLTDYKVQEAEASSHDEVTVASFPRARQKNKPYPRYESRYESNEIRRKTNVRSPFDNVEEGFTCPSQVKYARPQLARAASGIWKYIINTGEHTQTLRLEKCSTAQSSCSFISENYRSSCVQVYNYHRLLTWDNKLGLHMDIFKVPTCCSCHVHGYAELYPPHQRDPPPKPKENFPGVAFTALDQKEEFVDVGLSNVDTVYGSSVKKPVIDSSLRRPTSYGPGRTRPKKPGLPISRPYDKIPQQHAPNTRAPGYTGPVMKPPRPNKYNRPPFRRESIVELNQEIENYPDTNLTVTTEIEFQDDEIGNIANLQNSFNEDYQEPQRRINYNYHPIIDFFKPEAAMLQSDDTQNIPPTNLENNAESWKPIIFT